MASGFFGKRRSDLIGIKIVHESCAGLSWRKLEMQLFHEVEYAIFVPCVLVSLVEGLNTKPVHDSTKVKTSVTDISLMQLLLEPVV